LNAEQRKRVTIGIELAARPELLIFLDEPTSGLDSDSAWSICSLLRRLADGGQCILCTIHQPSATLFQMFDRLLLLKGGKSIYFGEIGQDSKTVTDYFQSHGARSCGVQENPAEWLMQITSSSEADKGSTDWSETWQQSSCRQRVKDEISTLKGSLKDPILGQKSEFAASLSTQLKVVTKRLYVHYWRTPSYVYSKILLCTLTVSLHSYPSNSIYILIEPRHCSLASRSGNRQNRFKASRTRYLPFSS
jgi:ABC-type multidrug transport system ATPase subunit